MLTRIAIHELTTMWQQADGTFIHPGDMDHKHLLCTLRFLERRFWRAKAKRMLNTLDQMEANKGSHARLLDLEQYLHSVLTKDIQDVWPIYTRLAAEFERRILSGAIDTDSFGYEESDSQGIWDGGVSGSEVRLRPRPDVFAYLRNARPLASAPFSHGYSGSGFFD